MNKRVYRFGYSFYDNQNKYYIERLEANGSWKFLFGGMTQIECHNFMQNPDAIESQYKTLKITGYFILLFIVASAIYFITQ